MQRKTVNIHHYVTETEVLGPGRRSALWVSGCGRGCPGCLASEFDKESGEIGVFVLAGIFAGACDTEGITISGGEPFEQAQALSDMLSRIKEEREYSVIIYTGYRIEELNELKKTDDGIKRLLEITDILIDGEYIKELDDGRPYVGSSNQRVIFMSDRYAGTDYYNGSGRRVEISTDGAMMYMTGVPDKEQLDSWIQMKAELGERRNNHA